MNKVQLTLTDQEAALIESFGETLGYGLTRTTKFLLSKAVEKIATTTPTTHLSQTQEERGLQALQEYRDGKTLEVTDLDAFFNDL